LTKTLSDAGTVATESLDGSVPVLAHYKIGVVPGAKNPDSSSTDVSFTQHGLFATQKIEAGTRIIREAPIITLPSPGDQVMELVTAFEALGTDSQEKIWSLNPADSSASELLTYMAEQITAKLVTVKEIASIPEDERTEEEQEILAEYLPKLARASEWFRIAARWHAARYSLIDVPDFERNKLPKATPITGLFLETAGLRHSCVPNCFAKYNSTTNLMTVHTMKPIVEGEELTVSTISAIYYQNASSRAAELHAKFGTTCACEACDPRHRNFKKHEAARLATHTRAIQLEHFCMLVEVIEHSAIHTDLCLRDDQLLDPSEIPSLADLRDTEISILGLVKNLKDTGCAGPELIRWYNALIDRIQPRVADALDTDSERVRWWRIILRHAIECEKVSVLCFGADSDEVEKAWVRRVGVEKLIASAKERRHMLDISRKKVLDMNGAKAKSKRMATFDRDGHGNQIQDNKEEWEIIATTRPIHDAEKIKNQDGRVLATLGRYDFTKK
jgi:hypothetical protein